MKHFKVENFNYNGIVVTSRKGEASYTAQFKEWTNDPGILIGICSDGKERLIPSCCLIGDRSELPKQDMKNKTIFGKSSKS